MENYKAGFARVDITPPVGCSLAGYFHDRIANRVRDHLYAKAAVIEQAKVKIALVGLDLICVDYTFVSKAKNLIMHETGISAENIFISATHTHTGPEVRKMRTVVQPPEEWLSALPRTIASVVYEADKKMTPVTLCPGRTEVEGYYHNRLFRLKDGTETKGRYHEKDVIGPAGAYDPSVQTLSAIDKGVTFAE